MTQAGSVETAEGIHITVITGSVRPGNYTGKAAALVMDQLGRIPGISSRLIEPASLHLPLPGTDPGSEVTKHLKAEISRSTGVVLATPEYHGGVSSVMKLVIENCGFPSALAGKPIALLGVAAGTIGAIKSLEQLRSICAHVGALVLPLPVSVAHVNKVFDADGRCLDADVEKRVRGVATSLVDYIRQTVCPAMTLERILRGGGA
jgi:NAD(P)H-dependent FMN reductase